ncbi:hypothetical protein QTP70_022488 [Hemibagrus guttatus]|uniref:Mitochondrial dicarboxylate carrier n=1 Tax=Hemibagrus guttatus TaxID=175788 RepID=A0AAE0UM01_9TELE|nr:hypothetical protein QTP70_022488 [Hemibagrus guttatus]
MMMVGVFFTGPPADAAGGEDEDDGDGHACGETRRSSGTLQWPQCLPPQTANTMIMSYSLTRFAIYETVRDMMGSQGPMPFYQKVLLGAFGGFTGGFIGTPADLVNVRMQNDMKLPPELRRNYKHALDGLYRVWCEEGTRKLFSGATMASSRGALVTVGQTKRSKIEIEKKTKWWKLKKEECCEEFRQKLRQALGGQVVLPDDWETTAEVIRETGRKVLGVSSGRRKEDKETWWWNEEVQDSVQRKRLAKKKWDMDRTEENRQEYKELQRSVKREVSKAKQKAYDELYTRLDTREGEKDLYRLARQRDRDGKDVQQVRVIKDGDGRVLTSEESVQRRWKEYFEELMNEENEREKRVEEVNSVEQKVDKIRKDEVRKASKRMKSGKAVGPDDIPVEVWKCLGEAAVEFLATLFNRVLESERMPEEWRRRHSRSSTFSNLHLHTMEIFMELLSAQGMVMLEQCLACYDQAKQLVLATGFLGDNILTHFLSSFIAGGCATFLCQPLDVLKTRLMNSKGEYRGVLHCLTETAKLGPLAFYKGLVPAGIRLVPHTILTFMFLEQLRNYFGIRVIS